MDPILRNLSAGLIGLAPGAFGLFCGHRLLRPLSAQAQASAENASCPCVPPKSLWRRSGPLLGIGVMKSSLRACVCRANTSLSGWIALLRPPTWGPRTHFSKKRVRPPRG